MVVCVEDYLQMILNIPIPRMIKMLMGDNQVIGVISKNSITYVEAIFSSYLNNETVVLLRDEEDDRIRLMGVNKVINPDMKKGWLTKQFTFRNDDVLAQIAFTSGTEGKPKSVLLTHQMLNDVTERLNSIMEVDASIREYVGIPANYSFGLGRFRAVAAVGGKSYLPENGFDLLEIKDMLVTGEINAVSAVPSLWRVLLSNKEIFSDERQLLKWIEIGSQYMSGAEKEELVDLFPNAKIIQHYGLTEASRSSLLRIDLTRGEHLESVGRPYGETDIKISETGRICIRGPHVSKTLLKNEEYISNIDEKGWLHTNDLGSLRDGYLYYEGRADDLINCGGIKLSPDALENELLEAIGLKEGISICAVSDELTGHAVLIAYLDDLSISELDMVDSLYQVIKRFGINNRNVIKTIPLTSFPVTSTNKVKRKELARLYAESSQKNANRKIAGIVSKKMTAEEYEIALIWTDILKLEHIDLDLNFYDLGGDSLSAIGALVAMESKGVPKDITKGMLQGMSIREIAQLMSEGDAESSRKHMIRSVSIQNAMTVNIVRGLMVLLVIFDHWHQGFLGHIPWVNVDLFTSTAGPLLAMGTPGFAIIYGVGAGYSLYPIFKSDPKRLRGIFSKTAKFLLLGIALLAIVSFSDKLMGYKIVSFTDFTNSFYSVLTYYLLISCTLFQWFKLINRSAYPIIFTALLAILSYSFHIYFVEQFAIYKTSGLLELLKLLFTAKYAYFLLLSGTMIGIVIGMTIIELTQNKKSLNVFFVSGFTVLILGGVMWGYVGFLDPWNEWPSRANYVWRWIVYSGVIMILLAHTSRILESYNSAPLLKQYCLQTLSVIGNLAFPLFVFHEMVTPLRDILVNWGLDQLIALGVPMALFLIVSALMFKKLHTFSFQ